MRLRGVVCGAGGMEARDEVEVVGRGAVWGTGGAADDDRDDAEMGVRGTGGGSINPAELLLLAGARSV